MKATYSSKAIGLDSDSAKDHIMDFRLVLAETAYRRIAPRLVEFESRLDLAILGNDHALRDPRTGLAHSAAAADIIWLSLDCYDTGQFQALTKMALDAPQAPQWIQTCNAGLDNPIYRSLAERGTRITKSTAQSVAIAEYVVAHALSLILPIRKQRELQAQRVWETTPFREIGQTRWTLVGYGAIGQEITRRIKPFGVHLTVARRSRVADDLVDHVVGLAELPEAIAQSDVVVLGCALNAETHNLAGEQFFAALKRGAILINIGRGGLVDEDALRRGLDRDQPAHAVLDVFRAEPLPSDSWLWEHPKIRVSAHTSNAGHGVLDRGDVLFTRNLSRFMSGRPLLNEASPTEVGFSPP